LGRMLSALAPDPVHSFKFGDFAMLRLDIMLQALPHICGDSPVAQAEKEEEERKRGQVTVLAIQIKQQDNLYRDEQKGYDA
jgi:hypothetical protein